MTKPPLIFFLFEKNSTKQEKKLTSPFALEGIFVYLYRDRVDITVPEHVGKCFIASNHWRLLNGCPLRLLWIWRRGWKCCKDYCVEFFGTLEQAMKHWHIFSGDEGWELKCWTTFVLSSYSLAYWCQEDRFELRCYSAELLLIRALFGSSSLQLQNFN